MQSVIVNRPHTSTKLIDGVSLPKLEGEWDEFDKKIAQLNAKAMNILYYALDTNEFNQISTYNSVKKIWDRLKVVHEGTNQVQE